MESKKLSQLLHFSQVVEATAEKHKTFAEQLEQRDAEVFVHIPALMVLKSIENDDKGISSFFCPSMTDPESENGKLTLQLRLTYQQLKEGLPKYELYNIVEKCLIDIPLNPVEQQLATSLHLESCMIKPIRGLAMQLSRFNPADWNKFLDVVIR